MPDSARSPELADWVSARLPGERSERYTLHLKFGNPRINIGDIATGTVKSVIDCLYPLLGGTPGAPEDWRIESLYVAKSLADVPENSVAIALWATG